MPAPMSSFETAAYARMLDQALARHLGEKKYRLALRLPTATSYRVLAAILREWEPTSPAAVLLRDAGSAVRLATVAELQGEEPWPPPGILAAADGTWVLERDGRVTRLY